MKEIDLLNKIANGEIRTGFKIKNKNEDIYEYIEGKNHFVNVKDELYVWSLGDFTRLNNEIEIIEEDKKIEKLDENNTNVMTNIIENRKKINELIEEIEKLKESK